MVILDTNHIEALGWQTAQGERLAARLQSCDEEVATTIVTVEETLRGWLAEIRRHLQPERQIPAYERLLDAIRLYAAWLVLPWDADAARIFTDLRGSGVRIPTLDLKIASIALAHDALLLTRNVSDFEPVPGLRFENWLD